MGGSQQQQGSGVPSVAGLTNGGGAPGSHMHHHHHQISPDPFQGRIQIDEPYLVYNIPILGYLAAFL